MVKLKGINVYPSAMGGLLAAVPGFNGEYVCRRQNDGHAEKLTVMFEVDDPSRVDPDDARRMLADRLGVGVDIDVVRPGLTAALTGVHERQKPVRLVDERT